VILLDELMINCWWWDIHCYHGSAN